MMTTGILIGLLIGIAIGDRSGQRKKEVRPGLRGRPLRRLTTTKRGRNG